MLKKVKHSHIWKRDPLDYYVEPEWVSQRLFMTEQFTSPVIDPWAGSGRIYRAALEAGYEAKAFDINPRFSACVRRDWNTLTDNNSMQCIVGNPPYNKSINMAGLAISRMKDKCALLLPYNWLWGSGRSRWLEKTPLYKVRPITPRPSMPPGTVIEAGEKPKGGRVDYAWFIWVKGYTGRPIIEWLHQEYIL